MSDPTDEPALTAPIALSPTASQHPLDRIFARRASLTEQGGYLFVPNLERIPGPIHIAPGLVLRRATVEEVEELHHAVDFYVGPWGRPRSHAWEHRAVAVPSENGSTTTFEPLDDETHRYHVMEYTGANGASHHVLQASTLASGPELVHGIDVMWGRVRGSGSGPDLTAFVERVAFGDEGFEVMSDGDAHDIVEVYPRFAALAADHPLRAAVAEHSTLRLLGKHVRLRLLGRFSILESLLVHKPNPSDPYDSITRQVKTKMTLLDRRFARPVRYDAFGVSAKLDKLWGTLYALRSAIAHGDRPTFAKGQFAGLRTLENADALVASAVRSVLRQVLEEPNLLEDLREC